MCDLCLCIKCFPNKSWSIFRWAQDLSTIFLFLPFLSFSSWVVIPPVNQQMRPLYHLSFPAFLLSFFLGCNSTSWPADGSLPSPNHSSARAGLGRFKWPQTSKGALVSLQSDSALKLNVVLLWRDYFKHTHISGCICSSAGLHLPSATGLLPHLVGDSTASPWNVFFQLNQLYCECDDAHMYQWHARTFMESQTHQKDMSVSHVCLSIHVNTYICVCVHGPVVHVWH